MSLSTEKPWEDYQHPLVRNLAWCLLSPSLLQNEYRGHQALPKLAHNKCAEWLSSLDQQPAPLEKYMQTCKSPRLGLIFEHYWHFYWLHQLGLPRTDNASSGDDTPKNTDDWICNLQINRTSQDQPAKAPRTLGEIDFVQRKTNHTLKHRELAVKFYLGYEVNTPPHNSTDQPSKSWRWIGPNCIDRLDIKLQQLSEKQLQLLHRPEARAALPHDWQALPLETEIILRGQLFYPASLAPIKHQALASELNPEHLSGLWYYPEDLFAALGDLDEVVILPKDQWLCTQAQVPNAQVLNQHTLRQALEEQLSAPEFKGGKGQPQAARPIMLSIGHAADISNSGSNWQEQRRAFVVPTQWPDTTLPCFNT